MEKRVRALIFFALASFMSAANAAPVATGLTETAAYSDTWDCAVAKTMCFLFGEYCDYVRKNCI